MNLNLNNYEEYLLSYIDGELDDKETAALMQFLQQHKELQNELALLESTKLPIEEKISFPEKQSLYRKENKSQITSTRKIFPLKQLSWIAAVAASIAILISIYFYSGHSPQSAKKMASTEVNQNAKSLIQNKLSSDKTNDQKIAEKETETHVVSQPDKVNPAKLLPSKNKNIYTEKIKPAPSATLYAKATNNKSEEKPVTKPEQVELSTLPKIKIQSESISLNQPATLNLNTENKNIAEAIPTSIAAQGPGSKNTLSTVAQAKQDLDQNLTEKVIAFQRKISHPLKAFNIKEIKIGNISFEINK